MKIVIRTKNVNLNQALKEYIQRKISSLENLSKIFQEKGYADSFLGKGKTKIEAWVEVERETLHHRKGRIFRAECQIKFPGQSIRTVSSSENLKIAIIKIKDELKREIKKYKEKIISQNKRKQRVLKKELKISPAARFYRKGRIREEGI